MKFLQSHDILILYKSISNEFCLDYKPFIFALNSFSPNDDGKNDSYNVFVSGAISYEMSIFNRWGEKIFKGNQEQSSWVGYYLNQKCQSGVYLMQIEIIDADGKKYKNQFYNYVILPIPKAGAKTEEQFLRGFM